MVGERGGGGGHCVTAEQERSGTCGGIALHCKNNGSLLTHCATFTGSAAGCGV